MKRKGIVKVRMLFGSWYVLLFAGQRLHHQEGPFTWDEVVPREQHYLSSGWGKES